MFVLWSAHTLPSYTDARAEQIEGTLDTVQYNGRFGELFTRRETSACDRTRQRRLTSAVCKLCAT